MKDIFFIGGLPRSGSTLLMNLLAQNDKVFATPTSGLHQLLCGIKSSWNNIIEHRADKNAGHEDNLLRVLKSVLYSYHNTDKDIIFDKSRGWGHSIEMIEKITGKKVKIVAPVRDVSEVIASFESLYRKGSYKFDAPGPMPQSMNTEGRAMHWASMQGEVGSAYTILQDAFQRGLGDRYLLIDYDYFTHNPEHTMNTVWDFLEQPRFEHDFVNVESRTFEDDSVYNYVNLHKIKSKIIPSKAKANEILGEKVCNLFKGQEFWKYQAK
jgi:sulfotransferase